MNERCTIQQKGLVGKLVRVKNKSKTVKLKNRKQQSLTARVALIMPQELTKG